jgi:hypothetical protein
MIVNFPDLDTLRLVLMSGVIPAGIAQKPAVAGFGEQGEVWVECAARLTRTVQKELKRLGAAVCKTSGAALGTRVSCWPELLPLVADDAPASTLEQTPVLFEVPSGEELARLVLEMLRLGNDRQSFRWLEAIGDRSGGGLLRVVGPPYYSLLRALDQLGGPGVAPCAFIERTPAVWVELGYTHPLAAAIRPPAGKILLLRAPRQWTLLPEAPFRDVYEIIEFQLPDSETRWQDTPLSTQLRVAPRLRQAGPADGAELWVLRGAAIDELNRFVQNAEDTLLTRLAFAVGEKEGQTIVVLRVRPSKLPPPVVMLPAEAYRSYLKLSNLFLPAGHILHPPLRRDVVRKLLAEDTMLVTWLRPGEKGQFTPESLPEDVFRPLTDWVDYVLDRDRELLQAWVQASQFEFEPFVCNEDEPPRPQKPPAEKGRGTRPQPQAKAENAAGERTAFASSGEQAEIVEDETPLEAFAAVEKVEPSEIQKELEAVEQEFLTLPGTLEDAAHQALWPRLAELNAQLDRTEDAGICWLNALWEPSAASTGAIGRWTAAWLRTEVLGAARRAVDSWAAQAAAAESASHEITGEDLDALLRSSELATADLRALTAYLAWSSQRPHPPAPLAERLHEVQRFLETHERLLPVRACWLAWYHLAYRLGHDVLALARARDRLLERLFQNGLRPEQDMPSFLRFAGQAASQRFRAVRDWFGHLHEQAQAWISKKPTGPIGSNPEAKTGAYVDLFFAFGFARLGEHDEARRFLQKARTALAGDKEAHRLLLDSFHHRIRQALDGEPCQGPLPPEITGRLEPLRKARKPNEPDQAYVVDSLRAISRILEPEQRLYAYRYVQIQDGELGRMAAEAPDITDRNELSHRLLALLKAVPRGAQGQQTRIKALSLALEQAPRIGEDFAASILGQAVTAYDSVPDSAEVLVLKDRWALLEKTLLVTAHFGQLEHIPALLGRLRQLIRGRSPALLEDLDKLIAHGFRSLRKLGMREEIDQLLGEITAMLMEDRDIASLERRKLIEKPEVLQSLLQVAGGWYYFGRDELAAPILDAARDVLFNHTMLPLPRTQLACTYVATLGQAPVELAKKGLEELFERLDSLANLRAMGAFYNQLQLKVIETAVLAVVSDDFTQGAQARRWLDDDEFLVRRRIHDDHRKLMAPA